jgi:hypothetical protein
MSKEILIKNRIELHHREKIVLTREAKKFNFHNHYKNYFDKKPRSRKEVLNLIANNAVKHNEDYYKIPIESIGSEKLNKIRLEPMWDFQQFDGVIAGGFGIRSLFDTVTDLKKDEHEDFNWCIRSDIKSDVDVFFFDRDKALAYWDYVGKWYGKVYEARDIGYNKDIHTIFNFFQNEEDIEYKHQLIIREDEGLKTPEELLDTFDLSLSKIYFDKDFCYIHKQCISTLKTGMLKTNFMTSGNLYSTIPRCVKYWFLYDLDGVELDQKIPFGLDRFSELEGSLKGHFRWEEHLNFVKQMESLDIYSNNSAREGFFERLRSDLKGFKTKK